MNNHSQLFSDNCRTNPFGLLRMMIGSLSKILVTGSAMCCFSPCECSLPTTVICSLAFKRDVSCRLGESVMNSERHLAFPIYGISPGANAYLEGPCRKRSSEVNQSGLTSAIGTSSVKELLTRGARRSGVLDDVHQASP